MGILFQLYGEGTRHTSRGQFMRRRIAARYISDDPIAIARADILHRFAKAKASGLTARAAAEAVAVPISTVYRWRKRYEEYGIKGLINLSRRRHKPPARTVRTAETVAWVKAKRQAAPWGKLLLTELLRREGVVISASSVGRVIAQLRANKKIVSSSSRPAHKPRRCGHPWAQPRKHIVRAAARGACIQIDTMQIRLPYQRIADAFTARDIATKIGVCMAATNATAASAVRFLQMMQQQFPYPISGIQTDGGSEFKSDFETACRDAGIALFVIPPRQPKHNGCVENFNATIRREVFNFVTDIDDSIAGIQKAPDAFMKTYNRERPHTALSYRDEQQRIRYHTPYEYNHHLTPSPIPTCH